MTAGKAADLANVSSLVPGIAPAAPTLHPGLLADRITPEDVPVVVVTKLTPAMLERPQATGRPQFYGATEGFGMTNWDPDFTGAHGLVPDPLPPPDMIGQQEAWSVWTPHTRRQAPTVPWDDGVTQASQGVG